MSSLPVGALHGPMAALVAPRRENGHTINQSLALDILDFVNSKGVTGVAVLGATGEFVHYDGEERDKLALMSIRRSRIPVIVNVSHSTVEGAVHFARAASEAGTTALLLMPPHFFRHSAEGLEAYYFEFLRRAGSIAPVLLYNLPFFTNPLTPELACKLLDSGGFAGIKDSSGDTELFDVLEAQQQRTPFRLLLGNDTLLASHRGRADGVISGCACGVPELIVAIDQATVRGDHDAVARLGALLDAFIERINGFPVPYGIQMTLALRGLPGALPALPLGPLAQQKAAEFRDWFPGFLRSMLAETQPQR